jgi:hypothetical protein
MSREVGVLARAFLFFFDACMVGVSVERVGHEATINMRVGAALSRTRRSGWLSCKDGGRTRTLRLLLGRYSLQTC